MEVLPILEVRRGVKQDRASLARDTTANQLIVATLLLPHAVVSEAHQTEPGGRRGDHRVAGMLLPDSQQLQVHGASQAGKLLFASHPGIQEMRNAILDHSTSRIASIFIRPTRSW